MTHSHRDPKQAGFSHGSALLLLVLPLVVLGYRAVEVWLLPKPPALEGIANSQVEKTKPMPPAEDFLQDFRGELRCGDGQLRIAWYGDSGVEADLITQTLRDSLQRRFGGSGVGFMPVVSRDPGYRQTIRHYFSRDWRWESLEKAGILATDPGIAGSVFFSGVQDTSMKEELPWVVYRGNAFSPRTRRLPRTRLFYGYNEGDTLQGYLEWEQPETIRRAGLSGKALLNEYRLPEGNVSEVRLRMSIPPNLPLYGISFESPTGIILDNFALRGIDGSRLRRIPHLLLRAFQDKMDYDLVVFSFGINALQAGMTDYRAYGSRLEKLFAHYRNALPGVPLLLVGPPDKGIGNPGSMRSDPGILFLTQEMRRIASKHRVAFVSLYDLMGGEGSMVRWVEKKKPRLASADYTHFNHAGAEQVSRGLLAFLLGDSAFLAASNE